MKKVRAAKEYVATLSGNLVLLAHKDFFYDHTDLFIGNDQTLLSLSERGQLADRTAGTLDDVSLDPTNAGLRAVDFA